jgi:hypothetical protein
MEQIPYIAYESALARLDRLNRRLWIVVVLLIVLLVASNCGWLWYESQFEEVVEESKTTTTTQTVDQDGDRNSFVGGDVNGTSKSNDNDHDNG